MGDWLRFGSELCANLLKSSNDGLSNEVKAAKFWIIVLLVTAILALSLNHSLDVSKIVMLGLAAFGLCFAINSSIHSYLILGFTSVDKVTSLWGFITVRMQPVDLLALSCLE